jgi:hypothetical protein
VSGIKWKNAGVVTKKTNGTKPTKAGIVPAFVGENKWQ